ncbi:hypothetical protein GQ85_42465, partial [Rhodococcus rhodochrous]
DDLNQCPAGYARVSTTAQDPALQVDALAEAGCLRIFTDRSSGARSARPRLTELLAVASPGDTLVVWRLDRLGRSLPHLIELVTELEDRGIGFRSLTESIDTSTSGGKLVFHLFGALADFERGLIRERTLAGLESARQRGRVGGRPAALTAAKKNAAQKLLGEGHSVAEVAEILGIGRSTLYRSIPQLSR